MWYRNRVWKKYLDNVMAVDRSSAQLLATYSRRMSISKDYAAYLEVYDLQRYKVIKEAGKIKNSLREKRNMPFIFVACKN